MSYCSTIEAKLPNPRRRACLHSVSSVDATLGLRDAPGFVAQRPQLSLTDIFPIRRNWDEPPLLVEGFEGEPPAAVTGGKSDSALLSLAPILSGSALRALPGERLVVATVASSQPSLYATWLGIPHLPVRSVAIYKSAITHIIYNLNAADSRGLPGGVRKMTNTPIILHPNCNILLHVKICFLRVYLPKLASDSLITSIIDLAIQRSRPL